MSRKYRGATIITVWSDVNKKGYEVRLEHIEADDVRYAAEALEQEATDATGVEHFAAELTRSYRIPKKLDFWLKQTPLWH